MNELDLIKESLQNELKNPQNYSELIHQSASNIANLLILKPIFDTLNSKIEELKAKNKLKRNYKKILNSNVIELLKMIDDPYLNEANVILIQKLILLGLSTETKPSEELLTREYLKIAKTLSGSEIIVLQAANDKLTKSKMKESLDIDDIYRDLANLSGLKFKELIIANYQSLVEKKLFKNAWNKEKTQIGNTDSTYLFTDLGLSFIKYLEKYQQL